MTEKQKEEKKDKIRCTKCGSGLVYVRIKDQQRVCRNCGFIENLGDKK